MPHADVFEGETLVFACGIGTTAYHLIGTWWKGTADWVLDAPPPEPTAPG